MDQVTIWITSLGALTVIVALALAAAMNLDMPLWLCAAVGYCFGRGTSRILRGIRERAI